MRYTTYILLVLLCSTLFSCRPKNILSPSKMQDVLVDIHIADGVLQEEGYNYGHNEELRMYYRIVLDNHSVTQEQFDSSLVWYTNNPTKFEKIYPKVVTRLEDMLRDIAENLTVENVPQLDNMTDVAPWHDIMHEMIFGWNTNLYTAPEPIPCSPIINADSVHKTEPQTTSDVIHRTPEERKRSMEIGMSDPIILRNLD